MNDTIDKPNQMREELLDDSEEEDVEFEPQGQSKEFLQQYDCVRCKCSKFLFIGIRNNTDIQLICNQCGRFSELEILHPKINKTPTKPVNYLG